MVQPLSHVEVAPPICQTQTRKYSVSSGPDDGGLREHEECQPTAYTTLTHDDLVMGPSQACSKICFHYHTKPHRMLNFTHVQLAELAKCKLGHLGAPWRIWPL